MEEGMDLSWDKLRNEWMNEWMHLGAPQAVGLLDEGLIRHGDLYLTTYTKYSQEIDIHAHCGIRTRSDNKRAAADPSRTGIGLFVYLAYADYNT